jgi:MSHA biogenesis protein MshL
MCFSMKRLLCLCLSVVAAQAAPSVDPLERPLEAVRFENAAVPSALHLLSRLSGVRIVAEAGVAGNVSVELPPGPLHAALAAVLASGGYSFSVRDGAVHVEYRTTVLYPIDYPQLSRGGSGSASITLGGANNHQGGGLYPNPVQQPGQPYANASDATQVAISQDNQNTFWTGLETELRTMLGDGDRLVLNRFSGVVQVSAPAARQKVIREFLEMVGGRITQQVEIEARLVEVTLRNERKLGIDWDLASASLGKVALTDAVAPLEVSGVGGAVLGASTFTAKLGFGQASAVIHALQQQGDVTTVAQPRLRTLNNQTGFIKIGQDQPFFRLQQSTTFQQGGTTVPVNQTQESFSVSTITIGTILAVTPQIDGKGNITLDVLPAITRLHSVVTSPDGRQTAPVTEVKQASTIVKLKDGETAVIGGLISEDTGESERSVPILGSTPILGRAFRSKASVRSRSELVIFLTPRLIR